MLAVALGGIFFVILLGLWNGGLGDLAPVRALVVDLLEAMP